MKNARQLLEEFTASSFREPKKAAEMFAEDGAFEMTASAFHGAMKAARRLKDSSSSSAISIRT
jgi:hypothetical protein